MSWVEFGVSLGVLVVYYIFVLLGNFYLVEVFNFLIVRYGYFFFFFFVGFLTPLSFSVSQKNRDLLV